MTKNRSEILMGNLQPEVLKWEIARFVDLEHWRVKIDEVTLFDLLLKRA